MKIKAGEKFQELPETIADIHSAFVYAEMDGQRIAFRLERVGAIRMADAHDKYPKVKDRPTLISFDERQIVPSPFKQTVTVWPLPDKDYEARLVGIRFVQL